MALLRKAKAVAGGRVALAAASKVPPSPWRTAATSNRLATCQRQGPTQDGLQKVLDHQPSLRAVHPLAVPVLHLPEDDGWDGQDQSRRPSHRCRSVSQPSGMIARRHHRRHRPGDRQAPVESQESNEEDADVHGSGAEVVAPAADGQAHGPLANAQGPDVDGTGEEGDHVGQGQVEDEEDGDAAPAGDGTAPEDNGVARQPHRRCHRQQGEEKTRRQRCPSATHRAEGAPISHRAVVRTKRERAPSASEREAPKSSFAARKEPGRQFGTGVDKLGSENGRVGKRNAERSARE
ncbi:uncharacterized protein LOC141735166 isoform X4 [Larus michahellis]|uniref:uncharacterized protein LOC141735166 isoform X4 n=1 Tax=Larus michahellis TaxID=119627 RepID=UPI003D9B82A7